MFDNPEVMAHLADRDAWKTLDAFDSRFASKARNARISLEKDGFSPLKLNAPSNSCWPMFAIPYNLLPDLCIKCEFIFLCIGIPSPDHPGTNINVMMRPWFKT
jgi:hypothetical protein